MGGAVAAIDYMKHALVESNTERVRRIELGEQIVVGVNRWTETEASPLSTGEGSIEAVDPAIEQEQVERLAAWRAGRDAKAVKKALSELESAAREGRNVMEPSIACAKAGVTTGEWGTTLRSVFGEYRAPTGISGGVAASVVGLDEIRGEVERVSARLGRRIKLLVGKPGLDGHSNGAEQIAVRGARLRHGGGLRGHPADAGADRARGGGGIRARGRALHPVGQPRAAGGRGDDPHAQGGPGRRGRGGRRHHPAGGRPDLKRLGVAAVYTPKNFQLNTIMREIVGLVEGLAEAA